MSSKEFKAHVDAKWFVICAGFVVILLLVIQWFGPREQEMTFVAEGIIMLMALIIYFLAHKTRYILTDDRLKIEWFMYNQELPYYYIQHVKNSKYPAAGRRIAWAADGLSIYYQQGSLLYIAPEDRDAFIREIKSRAPHIQIID